MDPAAWFSAPQPTVEAAGANEYHLWSDGTTPRALVVGKGGNWKLSSGGPPTWTAAAQKPVDLPGTGIFIPDRLLPASQGFLISPKGSAGSMTLEIAQLFTASGGPIRNTIDDTGVSFIGAISACYDSAGNLHIAYVRDSDNTVGNGNDLICYARRSPSNVWKFATRVLPFRPQSTAIVANGELSARIFYTFGTSSAVTLATVAVVQQTGTGLVVIQALDALETAICPGSSICLLPTGASSGRLFYPKISGVGTLMRVLDVTTSSVGTPQTLWTESNPVSGQSLQPRGLYVALGGPDQRARVAFYDARFGRIYYLRPTDTSNGIPYVAGTPVVLGTGLPNADLRGLHFGAGGRPFLLYRSSLTEGRFAFIKDEYDLDGNGRLDLVDAAFGSSSAGVQVPPLGPALSGVSNSANRLKLVFPAYSDVGTSSGALISNLTNARFRVEISTDMNTWTPLTTGVTYTSLGAVSTGSSYIKVAAVIPDVAPGSIPRRFARLNIDRPTTAY